MKAVLEDFIKANLSYWYLKIKHLTVKAFVEDSVLQNRESPGVLVSFFFYIYILLKCKCVLGSLYPILYSDPSVYLDTGMFMGIRPSPSPDMHGLEKPVHELYGFKM